MLKKVFIPMVSVAGLAFLSGCTTQPTTYPTSYAPTPIAQNSSTLAYNQKANTLFVLLDASSSTNSAYDGDSSGATKFDVEKQTLYRVNKTIPANLNVSTGLQSFGSGHCIGWGATKVDQDLTSHSVNSFQTALEQAECASGGTPANSALAAADTGLTNASGNIALLIVSDGMQYPSDTLAQAQALEARFGSRLCTYTIWVGNDYDVTGQSVLQSISNASNCGRSVSAADLSSNAAMANFVEDMLYTKVAVAPVVVTSTDSDGDGVDNAYDKCPDTPAGAIVNSQGCWSYSTVDFAFDSTAITSASADLFSNAVDVLQRNPGITVELDGHTDSIGAEAYNQGLSVRRAQAVKDHLVSEGIDASRFTVKGFGETQPIASNDTAEGRAENRRVGFEITAR